MKIRAQLIGRSLIVFVLASAVLGVIAKFLRPTIAGDSRFTAATWGIGVLMLSGLLVVLDWKLESDSRK